jgi:hypothetical protein
VGSRRHGEGIAGALAALVVALGLPAAVAPQEGPPPEAVGAEAPGPGWSGSVSLSRYFVPDDEDYLLFVGAADRGPLHLEGRYNYEDRETGSLFLGWNVEFGEELLLQLVPMLGGVVGRTSGVAPALELTLGWGPFEYYLETEVVLDVGDVSSSYLYAWSELTASPLDWLRAGLAVQRTRVLQSGREVSPGLLVGLSAARADASFYLFEPGADDQYVVLSAGVQF